MTLDGLSELRSLAKLITESVDQVEAAMVAHGTAFPSSRVPATLAAQAPRRLPEVVAASSIGCAAATQLVAALGGPMMLLAHSAVAVGVPAALATVTKGHVAEAVREHHDGKGADVKVVAKECGIDAGKLGTLSVSARQIRRRSAYTYSISENIACSLCASHLCGS